MDTVSDWVNMIVGGLIIVGNLEAENVHAKLIRLCCEDSHIPDKVL